MKKILVPCDFSAEAIAAFRMALSMAQNAKGEVHLVHVIEMPVLHDTVLMPVLSFEEALFKELEEKSTNEFEKLVKKYKTEHVPVEAKVLFGAPTNMLLDYAREVNADLILMGTKGASGLKETFVGSNTEKIVRHARVPVMAIRKYESLDKIRNIVFPNTLETEHQDDLIKRVKELQHFFGATLHIVYINTPTNFTGDKVTRARLQAFAKRFMFKDYTINIYNDPYEESGIINFATTFEADLIVMGTHGRKGLAHVINGSLAEDVVNHVACPIWTYAIHQSA